MRIVNLVKQDYSALGTDIGFEVVSKESAFFGGMKYKEKYCKYLKKNR